MNEETKQILSQADKCPFCGENDLMFRTDKGPCMFEQVMCNTQGCKSVGPSIKNFVAHGSFENRQQAVIKWNRRIE